MTEQLDIEDLEEIPDDVTAIDKMLANDSLFEAMLSMPKEENEQFARARREEEFSMFWEHTSMDKEYVIDKVKNREQDYIEEVRNMEGTEGLPDWLIMMEAQDLLKLTLYKGFKEEGLI